MAEFSGQHIAGEGGGVNVVGLGSYYSVLMVPYVRGTWLTKDESTASLHPSFGTFLPSLPRTSVSVMYAVHS